MHKITFSNLMPLCKFVRENNMFFEWVQQYCESKKEVSSDFPFDNETIVWKVAGKMFCLGNVSNFESINLKADAEYAQELRAAYRQIQPGYHMNKTYWNTVHFDGLPQELVAQLIDHSYEEVVRKLPKSVQKEILSK